MGAEGGEAGEFHPPVCRSMNSFAEWREDFVRWKGKEKFLRMQLPRWQV